MGHGLRRLQMADVGPSEPSEFAVSGPLGSPPLIRSPIPTTPVARASGLFGQSGLRTGSEGQLCSTAGTGWDGTGGSLRVKRLDLASPTATCRAGGAPADFTPGARLVLNYSLNCPSPRRATILAPRWASR